MKRLTIFILIFLFIAMFCFAENEHSIGIKDVVKSTVAIVTEYGLGTGFYVHEEGYIITCKHVVENARRILVYTSEWEIYKGRVVTIHEDLDIAIVKIENLELARPIEIAPIESVEVGEEIFITGHTYGLPWLVKRGIIGKVNWEDAKGYKYLIIDSNASKGNSGSAVVDRYGRVIGVIFAGLPGTGFVIQAHQLVDWATDIIEKDISRMDVLINW